MFDLDTLDVGLGLILVLAAAAYGLFQGVRWLVGHLPMTVDRRAMIERTVPGIGLALAVLYLVLAARLLFDKEYFPMALAGVLAGVVAVSWFVVRDLVSGVAVKTGRLVEPGTRVELDQPGYSVSGTVERLGLRTVTVATRSGEEAVVPYSVVVRASLKRAPVLDGVYPHVFRLEVPEKLEIAHARRFAREAAMRSHWSSPVREPQVLTVGEELEVTIFSLDRDRGADVESVVRRELSSASNPGSTLSSALTWNVGAKPS